MRDLSVKDTFSYILILSAAVFFTACTSVSSTGNPNDTAATVNGKPIKREEVEKLIKQQFQGQESKLSDLELAQYRLQALNGLIEQEVMYQKAEKEKIQVSDEEVTQAINEAKQQMGVTADEYNKRMQEAGETEQSLREKAKKALAIKKLGDKIAATVEPPKDSEVEAFFKGNPELFIDKRSASFAAIVIDPNNSGQNDPTKTPEEAANRLKELAAKLNTPGMDFGDLARQYSEDPESAARGGEWQALTEAQMKELMGEQLTAHIMEKMTVGQIVPTPVRFQGATLVLKLTGKKMTDENLTLDSPKVKQRVIELLTNAKKQLLSAAYQARAMDEARIENYIAKQVVDNPNNLSGARPADPNAVASPAASPAVSPVAAASPANSPAPANAKAAKANSNAAKK